MSCIYGILTRANLSAYDDAYPIAPESFSEAEAIICCRLTTLLCVVFYSEVQIHRVAQCLSCQIVDGSLQIGIHGVGIVEASLHAALVVQVHTSYQHGDGYTSALFLAHGSKFVLYRHILRGFQCEEQTHILQRLGNL